MATTVVMPSPRQREDVYEAFTRLSESCDNFDRDAAITACKDGIRASKVILALLGGSDPDASSASSSVDTIRSTPSGLRGPKRSSSASSATEPASCTRTWEREGGCRPEGVDRQRDDRRLKGKERSTQRDASIGAPPKINLLEQDGSDFGL